MILINLKGGLGNQMFQYAAAKRLAMICRTPLKLDVSSLEEQINHPDFTIRNFELGIFTIKFDIATNDDIAKFNHNKILKKYCKLLLPIIRVHSIYYEPEFAFDPAVLSLSKNTYLNGYFQSEKYFLDIESDIRTGFNIMPQLQDKNLEFAKTICKCNSVSIHIRRGDYLNNRIINLVHGICSIEYYNHAIDYILTKLTNPIFFIFSDDPEWVLENFNPTAPNIHITHNCTINSYEDLRLMSLCRHNIIANSSFSWWGAWLNKNPDKIVIAPDRWFADAERNKQTKDLIPNKWIRL